MYIHIQRERDYQQTKKERANGYFASIFLHFWSFFCFFLKIFSFFKGVSYLSQIKAHQNAVIKVEGTMGLPQWSFCHYVAVKEVPFLSLIQYIPHLLIDHERK